MKINFFIKKGWNFTTLRNILKNYRLNPTETIPKILASKTLLKFRKPFIFYMFLWPTKVKFIEEKKQTVEPHEPIIKLADALFDTGKYEECYKVLTNNEEQNHIEIKWRICRVVYNMVKQRKHDKAYKTELISKAYSIIAEELDSYWDDFNVQKWYALILDIKSTNDGVISRINELENVKKHMELAIKLNPNDAALLHILGEWCYQITEVPWHQRKTVETLYAALPKTTYEEALDFFLKAESVQPRFYSINLLRLGSCYMKLNKHDQAKYYLQLAASYPAKSNDDHLANKEAADLLRKLKVKPEVSTT